MIDNLLNILEVRFAVGKGLENKLLSIGQYERAIRLLGVVYEENGKSDDSRAKAHASLMGILQRKGCLKYVEAVRAPKPLAVQQRQVVKTVMVGGKPVCGTCKRCLACGKLRSVSGKCTHAKQNCPCPFPSRVPGWGKAQCQADKEALDRLGHKLAVRFANKEITFGKYTEVRKWLDGMARNCDRKLFAIRSMLEDREAGQGVSYSGPMGETVQL